MKDITSKNSVVQTFHTKNFKVVRDTFFLSLLPGVEKVNFFLGPLTENEKIFCQNPKVPPTLRTRETSFTPRIPCYHLKKCKKFKTLSQSL